MGAVGEFTSSSYKVTLLPKDLHADYG